MPANARRTGWLNAAVAAEIRALLGARNWKQIDLSQAAGLPKATVSSLLSEKSVIDLTQLSDIADALEMSPDDIVVAAIDRAQSEHLAYHRDGTSTAEHATFGRAADERIAEVRRSGQ